MRSGEVRGTVAAALLQQDIAALAQLARRAPQPPVRAAAAEGRAFIIGYARCLADVEPALAAAVIVTPYQSKAEHQAILALGTTFSACMPEGVAYRIDRFDLRNHLAAHLYAIAHPAQVAGR